MDNGNMLGMQGSYTGTDGAVHDMADVWFAKQQTAPAPQLGDLLSEAPKDLLPAHAADDKHHGEPGVAPPATAAAEADVLGAVPTHKTLDEEWLSHQHTPLI
jgi:hypothetical protein